MPNFFFTVAVIPGGVGRRGVHSLNPTPDVVGRNAVGKLHQRHGELNAVGLARRHGAAIQVGARVGQAARHLGDLLARFALEAEHGAHGLPAWVRLAVDNYLYIFHYVLVLVYLFIPSCLANSGSGGAHIQPPACKPSQLCIISTDSIHLPKNTYVLNATCL